jgi:hypothetical protein
MNNNPPRQLKEQRRPPRFSQELTYGFLKHNEHAWSIFRKLYANNRHKHNESSSTLLWNPRSRILELWISAGYCQYTLAQRVTLQAGRRRSISETGARNFFLSSLSSAAGLCDPPKHVHWRPSPQRFSRHSAAWLDHSEVKTARCCTRHLLDYTYAAAPQSTSQILYIYATL